jgi:hypothetical protein
MGDRVTLSAQVDEDSELFQEFEDYEEQFGNRSEALRQAIRDGINDDTISREEFFEEMEQQRREVHLGVWEDAALSVASILASVAILAGVATLLPVVPTAAGFQMGGLLLLAAALTAYAVQKGAVAKLEGEYRPIFSRSGDAAEEVST